MHSQIALGAELSKGNTRPSNNLDCLAEEFGVYVPQVRGVCLRKVLERMSPSCQRRTTSLRQASRR